MERSKADDQAARQADERLEALVEEALREVVRPAAVDVRPHVLAAWDERSRRAAETKPRRWSPASPLLKPAAALAGALVILVAVFLTWRDADRSLQHAEGSRERAVAARTAPAEGEGATRAASEGAAGAAGEGVASPAGEAAGGSTREAQIAAGPERRGSAATGEAGPEASGDDSRAALARTRPRPALDWPVEEGAANEPSDYMPGAPAGELGGGIEPMPRLPSIEIDPIVAPPTITDMATTVSDFPIEDQQPGARPADPGQSRGERR